MIHILIKMPFHLGEVDGGSHVQLLGVVEGAAKVLHPSAGFCSAHGRDHPPDLDGGLELNDMCKDFWRERVHQIAHHHLIPRDPSHIARVWNLDLFLVQPPRFSPEHSRCHTAIKENYGLGSMKGREGKGFPEEKIASGELLGWW
jgi:hypothetical protein